MKTHFLILAAGQGTRMKSHTPKVMHKVGGRTLIEHVIDATLNVNLAKDAVTTRVVVSPSTGDYIKGETSKSFPHVSFSTQEEQLGTGHAVACAYKDMESAVDGGDLIVVLYGDTPLITSHNLNRVIDVLSKNKSASMVVVGMTPPDPKAYGRISMKDDGTVQEIIEYKHANDRVKAITYCNSGIMAFRAETLASYLSQLKQQGENGEYYLTDIVSLANHDGCSVHTVAISHDDVEGVNDRCDLAACERVFQERMRHHMMQNGVTLLDPNSVYFSADTIIEADVVIEPHVYFGPDVHIKSGAFIRAFSHIEGSKIGTSSSVGPFARLREGTVLKEDVKIGNFVETKKTVMDHGAKASHLSYIGDSFVGARANIGAGTITCNYDGFRKHNTTIGSGAFIGSNTCLIAPVTVGENALIAAGSTITKSVDADALALSRAPQKQFDQKSPFGKKDKVA